MYAYGEDLNLDFFRQFFSKFNKIDVILIVILVRYLSRDISEGQVFVGYVFSNINVLTFCYTLRINLIRSAIPEKLQTCTLWP